MAFEIPDHFNDSFTTNHELLLQQTMSKVADRAVTIIPYQGESAQVVKQFGEVEFEEKTGRHEDTNFSEIDHKQRWIFPADYDLSLPVEREDELRMLDSPTSPYVAAMVAGWNRKKDAVCVASMFGTAKTGKKGGTSTAFPAGQVVAVDEGAAAATGLNVEKLIQAAELLGGDEELEEEVFISVSKKQVSDMLRQMEVGSADYNTFKPLTTGKVVQFMGMTFLPSYAKHSVDGSGYREIPVWVKSGIVMGQWGGMFTRIGERADKKYLNQVFMAGTIAATRTQEEKVVKILCSES